MHLPLEQNKVCLWRHMLLILEGYFPSSCWKDELRGQYGERLPVFGKQFKEF